MKTMLQLLLAQKLLSSKCVLIKNNLLPSDTVPLSIHIAVLYALTLLLDILTSKNLTLHALLKILHT